MIRGVGGLRMSCLAYTAEGATLLRPSLQPSSRSLCQMKSSSSRSRLLFSTSTSTCSAQRQPQRQKVVVISGPTGAGKSRLALELAKRLNGEIISADSVQVYKGLDIGSAKPSATQTQEVPHHLVDILHPSEGSPTEILCLSSKYPNEINFVTPPISKIRTGQCFVCFSSGVNHLVVSCASTLDDRYNKERKSDAFTIYYSVGQFYEDARQLTDDILGKGRVPIVTGGTGLYLRWFIYGKPDVPKASPEITIEVNKELANLQRDGSWDAAVEFVTKAGDPGVQSLAANDWYRLRRRLEILKSSGAPPSAFDVPYNSFKEKFELNEADSSGITTSTGESQERNSKDLDYDFICFFLSTHRLDLYRSIDFRCEDMLLDDGILSEANWLLNLGLLPNSNSASRAIGYRQAMDYLLMSREQDGWSSSKDFFRFLSEFQKSSRNFAKRQLTWFRNEPIYQWIDASKPLENVLDFICDAYSDQTGELKVPQSLCMKKDISNHKEVRELKGYRTRNRHFITREDCSSILEWVRKTQGQPTISEPKQLVAS